MAKWDYLLESEAAIARAKRRWDTHTTLENCISYNRILERYGRPKEWPEDIARLVEDDTLRCLHSKTPSTRRLWTYGVYKKHFVEVLHSPRDDSTAIKMVFGDLRQAGDANNPSGDPDPVTGMRPANPRFSAIGELEGTRGHVHTQVIYEPRNHGEDPIVKMTAGWGWFKPWDPRGGHSRYCTMGNSLLLRDSMKDVLDEMIQCGNRHLPK